MAIMCFNVVFMPGGCTSFVVVLLIQCVAMWFLCLMAVLALWLCYGHNVLQCGFCVW